MPTADPLASLLSSYAPAAQESKLPAGDHPAKLVLVHPARWAWYAAAGESGEWLPLIGQLPLVSGVGMVGTKGDLGQRAIPAIATVAGSGFVVCPIDRWGDSYLRGVDANGGTAYLFAWQLMRTVAGTAQLSHDPETFFLWLRRFADMLPPMDPETAASAIQGLTAHALAVAVAAQANPMMLNDARIAASRVQTMRRGAGLEPDPQFIHLAPDAAPPRPPASPIEDAPAPKRGRPTGSAVNSASG